MKNDSNKLLNKYLKATVVLLMLVSSNYALSKKLVNYSVANSLRPIVLTVNELDVLSEVDTGSIRVYKKINDELVPIPFQVDQRDEKQRYIMEEQGESIIKPGDFVFDYNDELVFMYEDSAERLINYEDMIEIELINEEDNNSGWVYISIDEEKSARKSSDSYIHYNAQKDIAKTANYSLGFNKEKPFILNSFQRKTSDKKWSENLVDTMKVEHTGEFLHFIDFYRNYDDYSSVLSNVKVGPVRVIRRTQNNVYMFLGLESPEIEMDYIIYKNCFYVDTLIDIPFDVGTFFSNVKTRLTLDWRKQKSTSNMKLYSKSQKETLAINGLMSQQKEKFSTYKDNELVVDGVLGSILITMHIPDDLPINYHNFLLDEMKVEEKPENQPGQWGHYGFMTTEWENVEAKPHHMQFQVYLSSLQ